MNKDIKNNKYQVLLLYIFMNENLEVGILVVFFCISSLHVLRGTTTL